MMARRIDIGCLKGLGQGLLVLGLLLGAVAPALADGGGGGNGSGGGASSPAVREDPLFREGVQAIKAGDYPRAVRTFETVVSRDGTNADAYNWLAYATRQGGDPTKAIPLYQKALALNPNNVEAQRELRLIARRLEKEGEKGGSLGGLLSKLRKG